MVLSNSEPGYIESPLTMGQWIYGYTIPRFLYVVAKLGIADLLKDGSQHCDALAAATNTHSDSLYRVLRALAGIGIFAETQPRCFELTSLANCLQSNAPDSLRNNAILRGEEYYQKPWANLMYSVETGKSAFEHLYGMDLFEYYEQNSAGRKLFHGDSFVSKEESAKMCAPYLEAYDFSSIDKLIDVGGSKGYILAGILEAYPTMTGILFDLPKVIDEAKNLHEAISVNDRFQLVAGSFFETVPEGGDAYLLREVIHLYDDERAIAILKRCHEAMKEQGRLLVLERVMSPEYESYIDKIADVHLLVMCPGGRERSQTEFQDLFESAGFKLTKIIPMEQNLCIIEGVKTVNS